MEEGKTPDVGDLLGLEVDDAGEVAETPPQEPAAPEAGDLLGLDTVPVQETAPAAEPVPAQEPAPEQEPALETDQLQEEKGEPYIQESFLEEPEPASLVETGIAPQEPPHSPPPQAQEDDSPVEDPLTAAIREQEEAARQPSPAPVLTQLDATPSPPVAAAPVTPMAHTSPGSLAGGAAGSFHDQQTVRRYLDSTIVPVLRMGMRELCVKRPQDPFQFLADYLVQNKPR